MRNGRYAQAVSDGATEIACFSGTCVRTKSATGIRTGVIGCNRPRVDRPPLIRLSGTAVSRQHHCTLWLKQHWSAISFFLRIVPDIRHTDPTSSGIWRTKRNTVARSATSFAVRWRTAIWSRSQLHSTTVSRRACSIGLTIRWPPRSSPQNLWPFAHRPRAKPLLFGHSDLTSSRAIGRKYAASPSPLERCRSWTRKRVCSPGLRRHTRGICAMVHTRRSSELPRVSVLLRLLRASDFHC